MNGCLHRGMKNGEVTVVARELSLYSDERLNTPVVIGFLLLST